MNFIEALVSSVSGGKVLLQQNGVIVRCLLSSLQTDGAYSLFHYECPPRFSGPHPHFHERSIECFHVLTGALTLKIHGELRTLKAGELIRVPAGVNHAFANLSDDPTSFLIFFSPGGMEGYFEELAELVRSAPRWPLPDMTPVVELGSRYDTFAAAAASGAPSGK